MKRIYEFLTKPIVDIIANITARINSKNQVFKDIVPDGVINSLWRISRQESTDYFKKHENKIMLFNKRENLWDYTLEEIISEGDILEFGVWYGKSINYMSKKLKNRKFYGFDSFEGLQEDWYGTWMPKNFFDQKGKLPKVPKNVKLIKGWFINTVPDFMENNSNQIAILHIDCDTYESTREIFELLGNKINRGTLIIFDEYQGYPGWKFGEYKAFQDFINKSKKTYSYIGITNRQCSVIIN